VLCGLTRACSPTPLCGRKIMPILGPRFGLIIIPIYGGGADTLVKLQIWSVAYRQAYANIGARDAGPGTHARCAEGSLCRRGSMPVWSAHTIGTLE
jgi:hypothetical protein